MPEAKKTANELAEERTELAEERSDQAHTRTELAIRRTLMAADRTLMAWVRTGTSLISFGFAIHKILQAATVSTSTGEGLPEHTARRLGLMLLFLGIASIVMGTYEYFRTAKQLNEMNGKVYRLKGDFSLVIGALVGLLGLFLFITILTRTEVF